MLTLEKNYLSKMSACGLIAGIIVLQSFSGARARTQWEIEHPTELPGQGANPTYGAPWQGGYGAQGGYAAPNGYGAQGNYGAQGGYGAQVPIATGQMAPGQTMPGQLHNSMPPQFNKNFWQGGLSSNQIPTGSVLTGILENTISSSQSHVGDTFGIALPGGFAPNGQQLLPQGTRLIGSVTATTPAARLRNGQAGSLQIAIQSLILPDGITVPFSGVIETNPNHIFKEPPQQRNAGFSLADYGQQVGGMLGSFTNGSGYLLNQRLRGKDFLLQKGEAIPIRVTSSVVLPINQQANVLPQTAPLAVPGLAELAPAIPGTAPALNSAVIPGLVDATPGSFNQQLQSEPEQQTPDPF